MSTIEATAVAPADAEPALSPLQRMIAIFVRPAHAWGGLRARAQWFIPLLVTLLVTVGGIAVTYHRALLPMLTDQWEQAVADGSMQPEAYDKAVEFMDSPAGQIVVIVQQVIVVVVVTLLAGLMVWFGVGFVLGTKLPYRLALEVVSWSALVSLPGYLLTNVLAWFKQNLHGVHIGFGVLLPDTDPPSKLTAGLGVFLDGIGPLALWYVVVVVLGASALSGAQRRPVAMVLGGLYLVMLAFWSALAAMTARGG